MTRKKIVIGAAIVLLAIAVAGVYSMIRGTVILIVSPRDPFPESIEVLKGSSWTRARIFAGYGIRLFYVDEDQTLGVRVRRGTQTTASEFDYATSGSIYFVRVSETPTGTLTYSTMRFP